MLQRFIQPLLLEFAIGAFRSVKFVCKSGNFIFYFKTETVSQPSRCRVYLKSIQHLSLGNDVTSSDKNIVIEWLKYNFYFKILWTTYTMHIKNTQLK